MPTICAGCCYLTSKDDVNVNLTPRHNLLDERSGKIWGGRGTFSNGEEGCGVPPIAPYFVGSGMIWVVESVRVRFQPAVRYVGK